MSERRGPVPIGADHAGYALKERLKAELERLGYEPLDLGTHHAEASDYPDYAHRVAAEIEAGRAPMGILVCGTGVGMAMAANRHRGVRAAAPWNPEVAELSRRHNDANLLALSARFMREDDAVAILERWLAAPFEGGRHARRVAKIEREADS